MSIRQALRKLTGRVPTKQSEVILGNDADGTRRASLSLPTDKPRLTFSDAELLSVLIDELCTAYWYLQGEDVSDWL